MNRNNVLNDGEGFEEEYLDEEFEQSHKMDQDFWDPPKQTTTTTK